MNGFLNWVAGADGPMAKASVKLVERVVPSTEAAAYCTWRCIGKSCSRYPGWNGSYQSEWCSGGYWTGRRRCVQSC